MAEAGFSRAQPVKDPSQSLEETPKVEATVGNVASEVQRVNRILELKTWIGNGNYDKR